MYGYVYYKKLVKHNNQFLIVFTRLRAPGMLYSCGHLVFNINIVRSREFTPPTVNKDFTVICVTVTCGIRVRYTYLNTMVRALTLVLSFINPSNTA